MKKLTSLILAICMLSALLAPLSASPVAAATMPALVTEAQAKARLQDLINNLSGKYFTVSKSPCNSTWEGEHGCGNCLLSNVMSTTWLKSLLLVPDGIGCIKAHFNEYGKDAYYPDGSSCYGFGNYAQWYIFAQKSSDVVNKTLVTTGNFNYETLKNALPGDVVRAEGHSMVIISVTTDGIRFLDCNSSRENKGNCLVGVGSLSYDNKIYGGLPCSITRASNYVLCDHSSNYSRFDGKGICTNCQYQFPYDNQRDISCAGIYKVKSGATAYIRTGPYQKCDEVTHVTSGRFTVTAQVLNCKGNWWYEILYNGEKCYVVKGSLEFVEHTHCLGTYYEGAHPHKEYTQCSDCGYTAYTGNTRKVSGCETCYPPAAIDITNPATYPAYPGATLRNGSSGNAVRFIQTALNDLGYNCGSVDGVYGTNTTNAVKAFQSAHGLTADGLCGQWTYAEIVSVLTAKYTNAGVPTVTASASYQNITVNWNKVSNATHYDVYLIQSPWGWGDVKNHIQVGATTTSCTFTSVAPGDYAVFVIARPNSDSTQSNWVSVTSVAQVGKPTLSASVDKTSVTLSWTAAENAEYYDVYLSQDSTGIENWKYHFRTSNTQLSHTFTNVEMGEYLAVVVAGSAHDSQRSDGQGCFVTHFVLDGILYEVDGIGNASVVGCDTSLSGDLVVPENANGYPVIAIMDYAFDGCGKLTSIKLSKTIYGVQSYAFTGCTSLCSIVVDAENLAYSTLDGVLYNKDLSQLLVYPQAKTGGFTMPDSVTTIAANAFKNCTALTSVAISGNVEDIGVSAFEGCVALTSVAIPNSVATIGPAAFSGCTALESIEIPSSVTKIMMYAFRDCESLSSVTIPDSVTSIGNKVFLNCAGLTISGYSGSAAETYALENNIPFKAIDEGLLGDCNGDGVVDNSDLLLLARYFAGWQLDVCEKNIDFSKDGEKSGADLLALAKHLAGWVEPAVSEWVLASEAPVDAVIVEEKWVYDFVEWTTSSSLLEGYTLDESKTTYSWGDYGEWSEWSTAAAVSSDSRAVETQTVAATYKTQYNYSKYAQYSSGGGYSGPWAGTWGGIYCSYFVERGWTDAPLSAYSSQSYNGTLFYLYGASGNTWYNEETRQVVATEAYTLYRYRDRSQVATYHLYKIIEMQASEQVEESDVITNVRKFVKYQVA